MFTQLSFLAGNQGHHHNFDPFFATQETLTDFHGNEAKTKQKIKMADSKKL
jgi:hypothetical protein